MPRIQRVVRKVSFSLHKKEEEIYKKIEEEGIEFTSLMREILRKWHRETFPEKPAYVEVENEKLELKKLKMEQKKSWELLAPEIWCAELGGVPRGEKCMFMSRAGQPIYHELSKIKEITKDDPTIVMHTSILDGTWKEANGEVIDEAEVQAMKARWEILKSLPPM